MLYLRSHLFSTFRSSLNRNFTVERKYSSNIKNPLTFTDVINKRREEATKCVVVQVQSENSFTDLYNYCSKFGNITQAHHYRIKENNSEFILIEYESSSSVDNVLNSACHNIDIGGIPAKSQLLWFKAASNSKDNLSKLRATKTKLISDGLKRIDENEIQCFLSAAENVSDQIKVLHEATKLNDLEIRLRFLAAKQIEDSIKGIFPRACALPFGSSVNGFGKMGCDLDLVLSFKSPTTNENLDSRLIFHNKENLINERSQIQKQMESLSDILQIFLPGVVNIRRILQARVPIIKFHHSLLNLEVDLTTNNISGVYMSELLYIFGNLDNRVRPLIFTIRKWAQSVGLTNPSPGRWITNFSLSCLVIFFLQQLKKPILPSLNYLNKMATQDDIRFTDDGINCTFKRNYTSLNFKTENESSLAALLTEFFEFYSQFDFTNKAISINKGSAIIKPDNSPLYIVNPLESALNVSKNISLEECERLRIEVRNAAWLLEQEVENKQNNENLQNSWGILNIFRDSQKIIIKPNMFFKPRMVEIKNLFDDDKISNLKSQRAGSNKIPKNIKYLNSNPVQTLKKENER